MSGGQAFRKEKAFRKDRPFSVVPRFRNCEAGWRLRRRKYACPLSFLRELGELHVTPERRAHLRRTLPADQRRELLKDLRLAPAWMHPIFRELAEEET